MHIYQKQKTACLSGRCREFSAAEHSHRGTRAGARRGEGRGGEGYSASAVVATCSQLPFFFFFPQLPATEVVPISLHRWFGSRNAWKWRVLFVFGQVGDVVGHVKTIRYFALFLACVGRCALASVFLCRRPANIREIDLAVQQSHHC